jgi:hypothetical protein
MIDKLSLIVVERERVKLECLRRLDALGLRKVNTLILRYMRHHPGFKVHLGGKSTREWTDRVSICTLSIFHDPNHPNSGSVQPPWPNFKVTSTYTYTHTHT